MLSTSLLNSTDRRIRHHSLPEDIINVQKPVDKVLKSALSSSQTCKGIEPSLLKNVYDITRHFGSITYAVPQNDDLWSILGAWLLLTQHTLPEWKEFKALDDKAILSAYKEGLKSKINKYLYLQTSIFSEKSNY